MISKDLVIEIWWHKRVVACRRLLRRNSQAGFTILLLNFVISEVNSVCFSSFPLVMLFAMLDANSPPSKLLHS